MATYDEQQMSLTSKRPQRRIWVNLPWQFDHILTGVTLLMNVGGSFAILDFDDRGVS